MVGFKALLRHLTGRPSETTRNVSEIAASRSIFEPAADHYTATIDNHDLTTNFRQGSHLGAASFRLRFPSVTIPQSDA
jgi:hypothetical protein